MTEVELRLVQLERNQRSLKRLLLCGLLLLAGLAITAGSVHRRGRVIEAERFVIRGADGYYRGELGVSPYGVPMLVLTAKADTTVVERLPESRGGIYLFDWRGQQQGCFQLGHRGGAEFLIGDSLVAVITSGRFMVYKNGMQSWSSPR